MSARVYPFPVERMRDREPWVSRAGLAEHLGISLRQVDYLTRDGLPSLKLGASRRYRVSEVERWLRDRRAS